VPLRRWTTLDAENPVSEGQDKHESKVSLLKVAFGVGVATVLLGTLPKAWAAVLPEALAGVLFNGIVGLAIAALLDSTLRRRTSFKLSPISSTALTIALLALYAWQQIERQSYSSEFILVESASIIIAAVIVFWRRQVVNARLSENGEPAK